MKIANMGIKVMAAVFAIVSGAVSGSAEVLKAETCRDGSMDMGCVEDMAKPMSFYPEYDGYSQEPIWQITSKAGGEVGDCLCYDFGPYKLVVKGIINLADLEQMWRLSFKRKLVEIDLGEAELEGGVIPANAFWHVGKQHSSTCAHVDYIKLRRIVLPSNIREIGAETFANAVNLEQVVFPEGLETIGDKAFFNTALREVDLPNSCTSLTGGSHFKNCYELRRVSLPDGLEIIPDRFISGCINVSDFNIPSTVKHIGDRALNECRSLATLHLPESLEAIGDYAFWCCDGLKLVVFPANLKSIGVRACEYWDVVPDRKIYSKAVVPPACAVYDNDIKYGPFGKTTANYHLNTGKFGVTAPKGCAEAYNNAIGWNYFPGFAETDDFPDASVDVVTQDDNDAESAYYDVTGREVLHPQPGQLYVAKGKKVIFR